MKISKNVCLALLFIMITVSQIDAQRFKGEGPIVKKTLNLNSFHSITINSSMDVKLKQGATQSVVAEGNSNIIERIKTEVSNGTWKADLMKGNYSFKKLIVHITIPNLEKLKISGSGDIMVDHFETDNLGIYINGSGDIAFNNGLHIDRELDIAVSGSGDIMVKDLNVQSTNCRISGSGDIHLTGKSENAQYRIAGTGDVDAMNLMTSNADININGSGDVHLHASNQLDVSVNGSGDVYYKGNANVKSSINGSGDIHRKNR